MRCSKSNRQKENKIKLKGENMLGLNEVYSIDCYGDEIKCKAKKIIEAFSIGELNRFCFSNQDIQSLFDDKTHVSTLEEVWQFLSLKNDLYIDELHLDNVFSIYGERYELITEPEWVERDIKRGRL